VVVFAGETETEPLTGCDPMPLSMLTELALVVDQVRVELWPELIVLGLAENVAVGAPVLVGETVMLIGVFGMRPAVSQACTTTECLPADILMLAFISLTFCFVARTLST
jgi:hypothetical protein